jgi:hypothetical protein
MRRQQGAMQHFGRVAFLPDHLAETRLILVDEPLSGRAGIDEDHTRELVGPALLSELNFKHLL